MKVVHLLPALAEGGVERVVLNLNRLVVRAGWESVVVSRGGRLVERLEREGGRHLALDLKSKNPLTYARRVLRLRRLLRAERPDIVCVHSRVPAWLYVGVRALDRLANQTIKQTNNQSIKHSLPPWITYAHGANSVSRYSAVMTRGDRIVVPSKFLGDYLKAHYAFPPERLRVVPNAVDTETFDPAKIDAAAVAELRQAWGVREGERVLMTVGRLTPIKGYDALIRDFASEGAANRRLVLVGGADRGKEAYAQSLHALAASLGVADRVVFAGSRSDIPVCLAAADEVVSANVSKPESFGLSVAEALSMNRPVRARSFGGVGEILAAVAAEKASSPHEAVCRLYGFETVARQTLAVYRELCVRTEAYPVF